MASTHGQASLTNLTRLAIILSLLLGTLIAMPPAPVHATDPVFSELYPINTTVNGNVWVLLSPATKATSPICSGCGTYTFTAVASTTIIVGWGCSATGATVSKVNDTLGLTWLQAAYYTDTNGGSNSIDSWVYYAQTGSSSGHDRITVSISSSGFNCFGLIDSINAQEDAIASDFKNATTTGVAKTWTLTSKIWSGGGVYGFSVGSAVSIGTAPYFNKPAVGVAPFTTLCFSNSNSNGCATNTWGDGSAGLWGANGPVAMTGNTNGLTSINEQNTMITVQFAVQTVYLILPCTVFQTQCWWYPALFLALFSGLIMAIVMAAKPSTKSVLFAVLSTLAIGGYLLVMLGLVSFVMPMLILVALGIYAWRVGND